MYRVSKQGGQYYALEIDSVESDTENIDIHVSSGEPVILCDNLSDFKEFGIDPNDVVEIFPDF